ncbi:ATPase [Sphingomonas sp. BK580]|uniref:F0F1 ATP synthase subunit B family protein n=1 Tax=Sphingomonas sp. BK580 TaxID=2586972 RepID=UPI00161433F7|nr:ATPase [Sphingomonas sp. BK580]MBB3693102.1 F-type H+-transporting ATPase subunit b [Sphingomonas sp. BK580]
MPQISQIAATYASQIFWLLITFGLLYFGIGKLMVPRVQGVMDLRESKIAQDLASAESARVTADTTEAAWNADMDAARAAAQAEVAAAKARAAAATEAQLRHADADLAERVAHHDVAVANAKAAAMVNVQTIATEAAQELVQRLAGVAVPTEAANEAVRRQLNHG